MPLRDHIWSLVIVTATTVLIWGVVAIETRSPSTIYGVTVRFTADGGGSWNFEPEQIAVDITIEGSALAIQAAGKAASLDGGVPLAIPTRDRETTVDLAELLRAYEPLASSGVTIEAVEPGRMPVLVDELRNYDAIIAPPSELPGIQTDGAPTVNPTAARVELSTRVRDGLPTELVVDAIVDPIQLQGREPGTVQRVSARLRLRPTDPLAPPLNAPVIPERAEVSFVIPVREVTLDNVRVDLAGPHEDYTEFTVVVETESLRNVTIFTDSELAALIERGEAKVIGLVHLTHREKEQEISEKPLTCFLVLREETEDLTRGIPVEGRIEGGENPPMIGLVITRKGNGE